MSKKLPKKDWRSTRQYLWKLRNPWYWSLEYAKRRCSDRTNKMYYRYGERGIRCELTLSDCEILWRRDEAHLLKKPSSTGSTRIRTTRWPTAASSSSPRTSRSRTLTAHGSDASRRTPPPHVEDQQPYVEIL